MFYLINQQFKRIWVCVIQTPVTAKYGLPCSRYLVSSKRISADVLLVSSQDTLSSRPFLHIVWPRLLTCALQISRHISRLVPQSVACKGIQWICKGTSHISLSSGACWTLLGHFPLKHFALYLVSPRNTTPRALCMLFDHVTQDSFTQTILHVVQSRHTIRPLFVVWSRHSSHFLLERVVRCLSVSHNILSPKECCVTELHNSREL